MITILVVLIAIVVVGPVALVIGAYLLPLLLIVGVGIFALTQIDSQVKERTKATQGVIGATGTVVPSNNGVK